MSRTDPAEEPDDLLLFTPVETAYHGANGWSLEVQRAFVAALARCGTVAAAARSVGRNPRSAYRLRTRAGEDSPFARASDEALDRAGEDALHGSMAGGMAARRTEVFHRGRHVGWRTQYDNRLAYAALRALDKRDAHWAAHGIDATSLAIIYVTKPNAELPAASGLRPVPRACGPNDGARLVHAAMQAYESWHDLARYRESVVEPQGEIGSDTYLVLKRAPACGGVHRTEGYNENILALAVTYETTFTGYLKSDFRKDEVYRLCSDSGRGCDGYQQPMLIDNVHGVDFINRVQPARFRLALLHSFRDLFRGKVYKSSAEHRFLVVSPVNRKLNVFVGAGERADNSEVCQLQSRAEIVDSITKDEGNIIWDGFVFLRRA